MRENAVLVHYNGWNARWDEWLPMESPRIAPFRTHTIQSAYSMFMSPNPTQALNAVINSRMA